MIKIAVFLGVCIAVYAIFSYLEVRLISKINREIIEKFLKEHANEIIPIIIEDVSAEITKMFLGNHEILARIGILGVINEVMNSVNKEEIAETGTEDNKKSPRN